MNTTPTPAPDLGPLPEHRYLLATPGDGYNPDSFCTQPAFTQDEMRAYAAQERAAGVAAERERWTAPVLAMLAAHDAGMVRIGGMMRAHGLTTMRIDGVAQAEFDAIAALRGLVEPNVGVKAAPSGVAP